jgi:hypothetical protein
MAEPFDTYSDYVSFWTTHWGTNLVFYSQAPVPDPDGSRQQNLHGTVRMSNEHLKVVLYVIARNLAQHEIRTGANYDATAEILAQMGVPKEDWERFWGQFGG